MKNKIKILLTGSSGFIGKNFLDQKLPKKWDITGTYYSTPKKDLIKSDNVSYINIDLSCPIQVKEKLSKQRWDLVIHLASNTDVSNSIYNPHFDFFANLLATLNIVTYCKFKRIIYLSSGAVYGGYKNLVNPNTLRKGKLKSLIPYALHKHLSERYIISLCNEWIKYYPDLKIKRNYTILRFMGGYGQFENPRKFIRRTVNNLCGSDIESFVKFGEGKNIFQLVYSNDLKVALKKIVSHRLKSNKNHLLDLSGNLNDVHTLNNFLELTQKATGNKIKRISIINKKGEDTRFYCDNRRLKELINWSPKYGLEEGLKDYVKQIRGKSYGYR